jgi:hypothetical protein
MDITGADKGHSAQENAQAPRKKTRARSVGSIRWQPRRWALGWLVGHDGAVVKPRNRRGVIVFSCAAFWQLDILNDSPSSTGAHTRGFRRDGVNLVATRMDSTSGPIEGDRGFASIPSWATSAFDAHSGLQACVAAKGYLEPLSSHPIRSVIRREW